ncbi:NuoI/complex I 23 kDa subunit family protein [Microtetraspora niveoalba]|uniref:NuoI/complex I 23 kDa subunit family protein n=1 Tax=Microtetraspora niveoalba TaxID=46175 RepID=UPI000B2BE36F|nr:NADH-quinone oxidoreductase subunit I [Microtetraspora niveoalba]
MARIPGEGLAKGLAVTFKHMVRKSVTQQYPEVQPDLPPRSRGVIALVEENCTVCMLCARECPDWCIYIDSHKETLPAPEGGRPRARNVLDRFAIDFSLCMYCGICVEVCPFDALFWAPEFEYAEYDIRDLLHEKDRLGEWVGSVPPPPPHEVGAEPPKEAVAASRPARGPAGRTGDEPARAGAGRPAAEPAEQAGQAGPSVGPSGRSQAEDQGERGPAEKTARREAPGSRAAIRAIRPPGALPKRPPASATPAPPSETPPETPGASETSGGAARPGFSGTERRDTSSTGDESPDIRPAAASPGDEAAGDAAAGADSPAPPRPAAGSPGDKAVGDAAAGAESPAPPPPSAAGSPGDEVPGEGPARREPPRALRNVRSIRPPGSLPKKDAPPDRGGEG